MPRLDKEKSRIYNKAYYAVNHERLNAAKRVKVDRRRKYRTAEEIAASLARKKQRDRAAVLANREPGRAASRRWRKNHPERQAKATRSWKVRHPEQWRIIKKQREYRLRGATGQHSYNDWLRILALSNGCCGFCGTADDITLDHRTPIIRGGTNDASNIIPACRRCNSRKGTRTYDEFMVYLATCA